MISDLSLQYFIIAVTLLHLRIKTGKLRNHISTLLVTYNNDIITSGMHCILLIMAVIEVGN